MAFVIKVAKDVLQSNLYSYLDLVDLVNLDNSVTSQILRNFFLRSVEGYQWTNYATKQQELESNERNFSKNTHISESRFSSWALRWISHRKIVVFNLILGPTIDNNAITHIQKFSALKTLYLSSEDHRCLVFSPFSHINQLSSRELYNLDSSRYPYICDNVLIHLILECRGLLQINLTSCENISDLSIITISTICLNLKRLLIDGCKNVTDSSINILVDNCPDIRVLGLPKVFITEKSIHAILEKTTRLEELYLTDCKNLNNLSIWDICDNLPCLHTLHLNGSSVIISPHVTKKTYDNIYDLDLGGSYITSESLTAIGNSFHKLKYLRVSAFDSFTQSSIQSLSEGCPEIQQLDFSGCDNLSDIHLCQLLLCCRKVHTLKVYCCNITDLSVIAIAYLCTTSIKEVDLGGCEHVTDLSIIYLSQQQHSNILSISLSRCQITDDAIISLSRNCSEIMELNLSNNNYITDTSLIALSIGCKKIQILKLNSCNRISDLGIIAIIKTCPLIRIFSLSFTNVTNISIFMIAKYIPNIFQLSLSYCPSIDDNSIISLYKYCKRLNHIDLYGCNITHERFLKLKRKFPYLML